MSEDLAPESVSFPNAQAAEFITLLSEQHPDEKFFITTNVDPGMTKIERKKL